MANRKTKRAARRVAAGSTISTIRITFEGMMILFVDDGRRYCDVGLLKYAPNHVASVLITKIPEVGAPETILHVHDADLESQVWLDIQKREPSISLFQDNTVGFKRATDDGNPKDFRWALDFEGHEMYDSNVTLDPAGFKSILRINDGTFYTQQKSDNTLAIKRGSAPGENVLGKVAVRLRADIALARLEVAYFSNGANGVPVLLKPEATTNYGIYVSQIRHDHAPGHPQAADDEIDAENYNTAVAINFPPSRKIHFARGFRATPDAVCLTATMSQTGLPSV
jgi:hypothetical protein